MKAKILIAAAGLAFLVFAGWIVGRRMKDMPPMPAGTPPLSGLSKLNIPSSTFAPPQAPGASDLPVLAEAMPEFTGIAEWLNAEPLSAADLRGKVVLIDFWTFSCINCIRALPYVTSWHEKYKDKGFTVIGVHTPEFAFEKEADNVREAIRRHRIAYPVPLDNDYGTWNAYGNRYWPAHYLFDIEGRLRAYHFGEGKYGETERQIQALIREAGGEAEMAVTEEGALPDFARIGTPETYLGYGRMEYLGSPEPLKRDGAAAYTSAKAPVFNRFYFDGTWTVEEERAVAGAGARIVYRYRAADANLVMAPPEGGTGRVEIVVDGVSRGVITVDDERLYDLFETPGLYGEHLLELRFLDPGIAAYAFTFG